MPARCRSITSGGGSRARASARPPARRTVSPGRPRPRSRSRCARSREVGPALGLVPRRDQSGDRDPQLGITKAGNAFLRRLLVGSAHYILGPFGPDCDLRRWGLQLADRGGKNARKRAVVAVARKLSVLLHRLWKTGEVYDPFYAPAPQRHETEVIPAVA